MTPPRAIAVLALPLAAVVLAGCGASAQEQRNLTRIRALATRFAAAHDASACNMLTGAQVVNLYGGGGTPAPTVPVARAKCAKQSVAFKGEPITITDSQILNDTTGKVNAENRAHTFTYSITFSRGTKKQPWKIDDIAQYKVKP